MFDAEIRPCSLFPCEKFRFVLRWTTPAVLPPYKGAVFRGAFGCTFRRVVCAVPGADCAGCVLRPNCLYAALFEPPAPPDYPDAAKFTPAPPPYVLNPPLTGRRAFRPGEELPFEMVLIGPAREALPYFIYTFIELGRRGLGSRRGKYELAGVDLLREVESTRIYDGKSQTLSAYPSNGRRGHGSEDAPTGAVTLHLLTPLRLKVKGNLVTELTFPLFFDRLVHRITLLAAFYGPGTLPPDPAPLLARATDITTGPVQLHWYDWERYSSRQKDTMKFGGLRGRITFSGDLSPFMPWLRLGEQVNVGQSTTFGLGRYIIA